MKPRAFLLWAGLLLLALTCGSILAVSVAGSIVRGASLSILPRITGVPVAVEKVQIIPWQGLIVVRGIDVGSPDGFKNPDAMDIDTVAIKVDTASLLTSNFLVESIDIRGAVLHFQGSFRGSNLRKIMNNIDQFADQTSARETSDQQESTIPYSEIGIDELSMSQSRVTIGWRLAKRATPNMPIPPIKTKNIRFSTEGLGIVEACALVLSTAVGSLIRTAGGLTELFNRDDSQLAAEADQAIEDSSILFESDAVANAVSKAVDTMADILLESADKP